MQFWQKKYGTRINGKKEIIEYGKKKNSKCMAVEIERYVPGPDYRPRSLIGVAAFEDGEVVTFTTGVEPKFSKDPKMKDLNEKELVNLFNSGLPGEKRAKGRPWQTPKEYKMEYKAKLKEDKEQAQSLKKWVKRREKWKKENSPEQYKLEKKEYKLMIKNNKKLKKQSRKQEKKFAKVRERTGRAKRPTNRDYSTWLFVRKQVEKRKK